MASACTHVGHFTKQVEDLILAWDETAQAARELSEHVAAKERELPQLMAGLPPDKQRGASIGENYLEEVDQLKSRLMGHKSAFDELAGEIDGFLERWEGKTVQVDRLGANLSAGELPRDVLQQIKDLSEFRKEGAQKMTDWTKEVDAIMEQWQKTETAYRKVIQ